MIRKLKTQPPVATVRCAIYTRKSTEEGLDQDFNSLDAQRESGEAFISSQKSEGWECLPETYDDGGFTGGNMERPALKRLLADIEAGKVDCVVVYKVDRLSRSLLDFAKMMEVFEQKKVSFVSVTQQFNTATSMGRLVLNVLLSFAQFEREIIGERIRDKIAANRRRGKWTGGTPILGYDVDRSGPSPKLVVNAAESARVRDIFALYLGKYRYPPTAVNGYSLKCFALRNTAFREAMFLDADNCPAADPTFLFESPAYQAAGHLFWPDCPDGNHGPVLTGFGLPDALGEGLPNPPVWKTGLDSGQLLVDTVGNWPLLALTNWLQERADYTYQFSWGDKDLFLAACLLLGITPVLASQGVSALDHRAIIQPGLDGHPLFFHRAGESKLRPWGPNVSIHEFAWNAESVRYMFQSEFQRSMLEPELTQLGCKPEQGHLIRGAFELDGWTFAPRPHAKGETFVVGRAARPDKDKWSSNTWPIYQRIQYRHKRAMMLGMDEKTHAKLGKAPTWADCLHPMALSAQDYFRQLHCTLPINGGARENWPRVGLEAMAAGVPIVAQDQWGWKEMIEHGVTGFLGGCDEELAHYTATLAYDEELRLQIARAARRRLVDELAHPDVLWAGWRRLFQSLGEHVSDVPGIPDAHTFHGTQAEEVAA